MDEFELIDAMVATLGSAAAGPGVAVGPGDDGAVLDIPVGSQLVVSTDTLVADRHFPAAAHADVIGYRSIAVATSDLAAMGATAAYATVSLTIEQLPASWARLYALGIAAAAQDFGLAVVGGNVARGPCSVTVTVHGHVPSGAALLRAGARSGDRVYMTGSLGGAKLALQDPALGRVSLADLGAESPLRRYWMPTPRLALGQALRGVASAAIDISDGLSSDLGHLCRASGIGCHVDLAQIVCFEGSDAPSAAVAGDDYELAFTAPPPHHSQVQSIARQTGVEIRAIGSVRDGPVGTVQWLDNGTPVELAQGYRHFQ